MSDRLAELRRQRALIQEHLAWLEREIAAETSGARPATVMSRPSPPEILASGNGTPALSEQPSLSGVAPTAAALATTSVPGPGATPAAADADRILEQYRVGEASLQTDVRKGCFLYFGVAFALLIGVVALLYFLLSAR